MTRKSSILLIVFAFIVSFATLIAGLYFVSAALFLHLALTVVEGRWLPYWAYRLANVGRPAEVELVGDAAHDSPKAKARTAWIETTVRISVFLVGSVLILMEFFLFL